MNILALAFACEPGKGSEPGAGWSWVRLLARLGDTWVITRTEYREAIEGALSTTPEARALHFVYLDLPEHLILPWAQRAVNRTYYMLWQVAALKRARELHSVESFDLVWHLTWANVWLGSLAALTGPPFVYGPVGGGVRPPWRLLPALGIRGAAYESLRAAGQVGGRYANPVARIAWRRARIILVQNRETRDFLPRRHRAKAVIFPNPILLPSPGGPQGPHRVRRSIGSEPTALYAGRLLPLKGVALAIRAIASSRGWRLVIVGSGWDEPRLRRLSRRLNVQDRVEFTGWLSRDEVVHAMREQADLLLFPSMHDEAPAVVVEALACGLPVVCLNIGGPPLLAGAGGEVVNATGSVVKVVSRLAQAISIGPRPTARSALDRSAQFQFDAVLARLEPILAEFSLAQTTAHESGTNG